MFVVIRREIIQKYLVDGVIIHRSSEPRAPLLSTVEELNVAMLHVLLVFRHGSPGVAVRSEPHVGLSAGAAVIVVMNHHVHRVRGRAEPLSDLLTRRDQELPQHPGSWGLPAQ